MRIITGQYTVGNSTYSYEMQYPEQMVFIYSRHVFVRFTVTDENGDPVQGRRLQCVVQIGTDMNTGSFRYTDADGVAVFDIARILQMMTRDREQEMSGQYATHAWHQHLARIRIYDGAVLAATDTCETANGSDMVTDNWRYNGQQLKWWTAYPFTFDIFNSDSLLIRKDENIGIVTEVRNVSSTIETQFVRRVATEVMPEAPVRKVTLQLPARDGVAFLHGVMQPSNDKVTLHVEHCEADERKTYMRWLGPHGEIFYWLFGNDSEQLEVKQESYMKAVKSNTYEGTESNMILDGGMRSERERTIERTLYTELMDGPFYDLVSSMTYSPYVDMYLGDDRWQRVTVKDATCSKDISHSSGLKRNRIAVTIGIGEGL